MENDIKAYKHFSTVFLAGLMQLLLQIGAVIILMLLWPSGWPLLVAQSAIAGFCASRWQNGPLTRWGLVLICYLYFSVTLYNLADVLDSFAMLGRLGMVIFFSAVVGMLQQMLFLFQQHRANAFARFSLRQLFFEILGFGVALMVWRSAVVYSSTVVEMTFDELADAFTSYVVVSLIVVMAYWLNRAWHDRGWYLLLRSMCVAIILIMLQPLCHLFIPYGYESYGQIGGPSGVYFVVFAVSIASVCMDRQLGGMFLCQNGKQGRRTPAP